MKKKKIKNTQQKPNECKFYYFVGHVDSSGEVTPLLLTNPEFKKAAKRAKNNKEDVPENFLVFSQEHKEKI